jgi:predicted regulator of Ras-like GTPase activity (Roadblock/LC7/MglB family)
MPYQNILEKLVNSTPRAIGAILVDWEGEAVQEYCHCDSYEIRFLAAHQAIILSRIRELHNDVGHTSRIEDFVVTVSNAHLIIGSIDEDYSLVMNVDRMCPVHLALYHFRAAVIELRKEI